MGDLLVETQGAPTTPAAGQAIIFVDNQSESLVVKDEAGKIKGGGQNAAVAQQSIVTSDTYITNSDLQIPAGGMQVGMVFEWEIFVTRSGAGTAVPVFIIRTGSLKSTGDTARVTLTSPGAQTGVADTGKILIQATVRTVAIGGVIFANVHIQHNLAAAGLANTPAGFAAVGASGSFDNTAMAGLFVGISINSGATSTWLIEQVHARIRY